MSGDEVFFAILATIIIGSAVMFIVSKNMVHAVLYFLMSMLAMSGLFLLLKAPFIAATQILVYAGAITVLILFVVMLTITRVPEVKIFGQTRTISPLIAGLAFFGVTASVLSRTKFEASAALFNGQRESDFIDKAQSTSDFGQQIFNQYLLPFEIAAFLLLVALVAAVYLAVGEKGE